MIEQTATETFMSEKDMRRVRTRDNKPARVIYKRIPSLIHVNTDMNDKSVANHINDTIDYFDTEDDGLVPIKGRITNIIGTVSSSFTFYGSDTKANYCKKELPLNQIEIHIDLGQNVSVDRFLIKADGNNYISHYSLLSRVESVNSVKSSKRREKRYVNHGKFRSNSNGAVSLTFTARYLKLIVLEYAGKPAGMFCLFTRLNTRSNDCPVEIDESRGSYASIHNPIVKMHKQTFPKDFASERAFFRSLCTRSKKSSRSIDNVIDDSMGNTIDNVVDEMINDAIDDTINEILSVNYYSPIDTDSIEKDDVSVVSADSDYNWVETDADYGWVDHYVELNDSCE